MRDITGQLLSAVDVDPTPAPVKEPEAPEIEETDAENVSLDEAHAAPEQEEHVEEAPEETPAQQSWKQLREKAQRADDLQRERDEAYRMLQFVEKNMYGQQKKEAQPVEEEEFDINSLPDEEYTDNKQLKRILKQQNKHYKKIQEDLERSKKSSYVTNVESRIRSEFGDFKDVVSAENVEKLKQQKPHIFKSLSYNPDLYEQAVGAYEAIRDFGIYKSNKYAREDYQLERNANKPRSAAAISPQKKASPLDNLKSYEYGLSKEDSERLYEDTKKKAGWGLY